MFPLPPQAIEATIKLLADIEANRINQAAQVEQVKRRLNPGCYLDEPEEVFDIPNSSASASPTVTVVDGETSTSTTTTLPFDVSPSPSPEAY